MVVVQVWMRIDRSSDRDGLVRDCATAAVVVQHESIVLCTHDSIRWRPRYTRENMVGKTWLGERSRKRD